MKPEMKDVMRAVRKRKATEAVASGTGPKRGRLPSPGEEYADPAAGPSAPEVSVQEPTDQQGEEEPSQATGAGSAGGAPGEEVGAAGDGADAAAEAECPPSGRDKGKGPASEGIDPLRRSRRRESGAKYVSLGISWDDEGLDDPAIAGRLLETIRLKKDWEKIKASPFTEMADRSDCTLYRLIHEHAVLKDVGLRTSKRMQLLSAKLREVIADREAIKAERDAAKEADEGLREALRVALEEKEALRGSLEAREAECKTLRTDFEKDKRHAKKAYSKVKEKLQAAEASRDAAVRRREDDVLLAGVRAVNEYKASDAFKDEMAEAGASTYLSAVELMMERVLRRYPGLDLAGIESDEEDEEDVGLRGQGAVGLEEGEVAPLCPPAADPPAAAASEEIDVVAIGEAAVQSTKASASEGAL